MKENDLASSIIKKMFWTIIILIVALVGTNIAWIVYINQFDFVTETIEQEASDIDNSTINQTCCHLQV